MFRVENITPETMKKYRLWLNLSQKRMAELLGVATNTYALWERGDKTPESPELVALGFESLLNRKVVDESKSEGFRKLFKNLDEEIDFYIKDIDRMQKIRVGKTVKY